MTQVGLFNIIRSGSENPITARSGLQAAGRSGMELGWADQRRMFPANFLVVGIRLCMRNTKSPNYTLRNSQKRFCKILSPNPKLCSNSPGVLSFLTNDTTLTASRIYPFIVMISLLHCNDLRLFTDIIST